MSDTVTNVDVRAGGAGRRPDGNQGRGRAGGVPARALWSVVAQGLSSGSNSVLQIALLVTMAPRPFGVLVIGLSAYFLALALGRAWVGDPLVALSGAAGDAADEAVARQGAVEAAWIGSRHRLLVLAAGAVLAVVAWAVPSAAARPELVGLAVALPALLLQDGYRYLFWARRQPRLVALVDGVWLAVTVAAGLAGLATHGWADPRGRWLLGAWLAGGVCSWLLAARLAGAGAGVSGPAGASQAGRGTAFPGLSASQALLAVESNGLPLAVGATAGPVVTAAFRAALIPFLPVVTVTGALRVLALPELRAARDRGRLGAMTALVAGLNLLVSLVLGGAALVVVYRVPVAWLGPTGRLVRPWFGLGALVIGVRAVGAALADAVSLAAGPARALAYRFTTSAVDWAGTLAGGMAAGVAGVAVGRSGAALASTALWALALALTPPRSGS